MKIEVDKKYFVLAVILGLTIASFIVGYAYAGASGVGHTAEEIESIPWSKITDVPAGFADGEDNTGIVIQEPEVDVFRDSTDSCSSTTQAYEIRRCTYRFSSTVISGLCICRSTNGRWAWNFI